MPESNSVTQPVDVDCWRCTTKLALKIWVVVDGLTDPQLTQKIRDETLQDATCHKCAATMTLDLPLLYYVKSNEPPFAFCPPANTSKADAQATLLLLLQMLIATAGNEVRVVLRTSRVASVTKAELAEALRAGTNRRRQ